jgi:hypothetical protein
MMQPLNQLTFFQMNNRNDMNTENKNRWMIWAIVILVVMNLTTFITIVYNRRQLSDLEQVSVQGESMPGNASMKYSGRYFRDSLDLSPDQMRKFSEFNPRFRQAVMAINLDMAKMRNSMLIEMAKNECDTNILNNLSDSIGYLHARLKKETYQYYIYFKNICNKEQQKKLEQLFGEMFNSDTQMGQNGRGPRGGMKYGWAGQIDF